MAVLIPVGDVAQLFGKGPRPPGGRGVVVRFRKGFREVNQLVANGGPAGCEVAAHCIRSIVVVVLPVPAKLAPDTTLRLAISCATDESAQVRRGKRGVAGATRCMGRRAPRATAEGVTPNRRPNAVMKWLNEPNPVA